MTPAQAYGHPDFVTDVPVEGPTDEGIRRADCRWTEKRKLTQPACVDCSGGPIPMWAQHSLCIGNRLTNSGLGENLSLGGAPARGFALGDVGKWTLQQSTQVNPGDWFAYEFSAPASWTDADVITFKQSLAALGFDSTQTPPILAPTANLARGVAEQGRYIGTKPYKLSDAVPAGTQVAVVTIGAGGTAAAADEGLSTGAMVGIAAAGVVIIGGVIYFVTRKR